MSAETDSNRSPQHVAKLNYPDTLPHTISQDADSLGASFASAEINTFNGPPERAEMLLELPQPAGYMGLHRTGTHGLSHGEEPQSEDTG